MKTTETNIVIDIEKKFVKDLLSGEISEVRVASDSYCPEISISKFGINSPNYCEPYIFYNLKDNNVVLGTRQSKSVSIYRRTGEDTYIPIVKVSDLINDPGNVLAALNVDILKDYINKKVTSTLEKSQSVFCEESDIVSIGNHLHNGNLDYKTTIKIFLQFLHQDFCDSNSELVTYLVEQLKSNLFDTSCREESELKELASKLHTCLKNQRERGHYYDATKHFFDCKTIEVFFGEIIDFSWFSQRFVAILVKDFIFLSEDKDETEAAIAKGINRCINRSSERLNGVVISFGDIYFLLNSFSGRNVALIFDGLKKVSIDAGSVIVYTSENNFKELEKLEELRESKSLKEFLNNLEDESCCDLSNLNIVEVECLSQEFLKKVFNTSSSDFVLRVACDVGEFCLLSKQIEFFVDIVGALCNNKSFWKTNNTNHYTIDKFCKEMKTLSGILSKVVSLNERLTEFVVDVKELFKTVKVSGNTFNDKVKEQGNSGVNVNGVTTWTRSSSKTDTPKEEKPTTPAETPKLTNPAESKPKHYQYIHRKPISKDEIKPSTPTTAPKS
jgi:hypothetical protein